MRYDLVFEGGGARGLIFVGALQALEERGHSHGRLLGTSAGAITAALLAAGYSASELAAAVSRTVGGLPVFQTFLGTPPPFTRAEIEASGTRAFLRDVDLPLLPDALEERLEDALLFALMRFPAHRNLMAFVERGGWYAAEAFVPWLTAQLDAGSFHGSPRRFGAATLLEFHKATGVDLSVVVTDTSDARLRVLNHRTAPHCPVVWAVRMSMNLPFVWEEVRWRAEWGTYLGRAITGHAIADGGMLSSFPLELFVSDEPYVVSLMGPRSDASVLGLLIDETLPVAGDVEPPSAPPGELTLASLRVLERLTRLVKTMTAARDRMVIDAFPEIVARLPAQGYGTIEFAMSDARRARLIRSGYQALGAFLDQPRPAHAPTRDPASLPTLRALADRSASSLLQP